MRRFQSIFEFLHIKKYVGWHGSLCNMRQCHFILTMNLNDFVQNAIFYPKKTFWYSLMWFSLLFSIRSSYFICFWLRIKCNYQKPERYCHFLWWNKKHRGENILEFAHSWTDWLNVCILKIHKRLRSSSR